MGRGISRRSMLKGAALGMAGASLSMGAAAAWAETGTGEIVAANVSPDNDATQKYQDIFDVLVLGCGAAGMSAAWQAAQEGCRVGLVEIMPNYYEANSSICAGMLWGWNSAIQKANGVPEQDYDTCMAYLEACGGGHEDRAMSDVFIREADGILEWMLGLGMELPEDGLTAFGAEYLVAEMWLTRCPTATPTFRERAAASPTRCSRPAKKRASSSSGTAAPRTSLPTPWGAWWAP